MPRPPRAYEGVDAAFLEDAHAQAIAKAHAAGKKIVGIPILPFGHSVKDVGDNAQVAQDVNAWIRAHDKRSEGDGSFDGDVIS